MCENLVRERVRFLYIFDIKLVIQTRMQIKSQSVRMTTFVEILKIEYLIWKRKKSEGNTQDCFELNR